MDKIDVLKQIISQFPHIKYKDELIQDICADNIFGSGIEAKFLSLFLTRLKQINTFGYQAITAVRNGFEKLTGAPGLYSMHIDLNNLNYRILYTIDNKDHILLLGFNEKAGKRVSDYTKPISIAKQRLSRR